MSIIKELMLCKLNPKNLVYPLPVQLVLKSINIDKHKQVASYFNCFWVARKSCKPFALLLRQKKTMFLNIFIPLSLTHPSKTLD